MVDPIPPTEPPPPGLEPESRATIAGDLVILDGEVRLLDLPLAESLATARGTPGGARHRRLTVVRLGAGAGRSGWGECAALTDPGYWFETADSSHRRLTEAVGRLVGRPLGELIDPAVAGPLSPADGHPMAVAALEMAALDLALSISGWSLARWLGGHRATVAAGVAVGLAPIDEVVGRIAALRDRGYGRVKIKVEPGHDVEVVAAVAARVGLVGPGAGGGPGIELHVDANGAYRPGDDGLEVVTALARMGVTAIEQPFPADEPGSSAELVRRLAGAGLATLVMADEAAVTPASALDLLARRSATGVVVKPSRLGGLAQARDLAIRAGHSGHPVEAGGMLESGLGRHALTALAALDPFTVTGDLSPARRWLADDPWPDVATRTVDRRLHVVVPSGPGVAAPPDREVLDRYTIERWST